MIENEVRRIWNPVGRDRNCYRRTQSGRISSVSQSDHKKARELLEKPKPHYFRGKIKDLQMEWHFGKTNCSRYPKDRQRSKSNENTNYNAAAYPKKFLRPQFWKPSASGRVRQCEWCSSRVGKMMVGHWMNMTSSHYHRFHHLHAGETLPMGKKCTCERRLMAMMMPKGVWE